MQLTREQARAAGAVIEPVGVWGGKLCHCGICGETSKCTPVNDFYVRAGENRLRCSVCVLLADR